MYSVLVEYYDFKREPTKTAYYKKKLQQLLESKEVDRVLGPPDRRRSKVIEIRKAMQKDMERRLEKRIKDERFRSDIKDRVIGTNLQLQLKTIESK